MTARFLIVVGIGLGVPAPIRRGRSAQPEIIVPRASRFRGLTRLIGSSKEVVVWVAEDM